MLNLNKTDIADSLSQVTQRVVSVLLDLHFSKAM